MDPVPVECFDKLQYAMVENSWVWGWGWETDELSHRLEDSDAIKEGENWGWGAECKD